MSLFDRMAIRIEYTMVNPIEIIIRIVSIHSNFEEIIFSIIISFEKNPDMKGIPIRDMEVIPITEDMRGIIIEFIPIIRISW